ncbi:MAG TPA: hypothetical protein VFE47_15950 [Tepidisphaeraceae bacterium]|nr:hypothetical protein [Tepidisphaeraceae bacterium]
MGIRRLAKDQSSQSIAEINHTAQVTPQTRPSDGLAHAATGTGVTPIPAKVAADPNKHPPLIVPPLTAHATASLVRVDDTSAGNWVGRYGKQGYYLAMDGAVPHLPGGVNLAMAGAPFYAWSPVTTDPRGPSLPQDPAKRTSGQWFTGDKFTLDLDFRGAARSYQVALYLLDWDSDQRAQKLEAVDPDTGAVLLTRTDDHFRHGRYLILKLSGHVILRITRVGGVNCTLSGIFFDDIP